MPLPVFRGSHNVSWICFHCGIPNFSTSLFDTVLADSLPTSNSFSGFSRIDSRPSSSSFSGSFSGFSEVADSSHIFQSPSSSGTSHSSAFGSQIGSPLHTSSPNRANPRTHIKNMMRILVINFQSIRAKKTPFWLLLTECNPDIIIGSETWLSPGIYEREILPCGYHIVARKDRAESPHGGVMIATKDNIIGSEIDLDTDTELTAAVFECPGKKTLVIGALYRPPTSTQDYAQELCSKIESLYQQYPRSTIWIAGDANLPDIDWELNAVNGNSNPISLNQLFLDIVYDNGSEQMVKFPTRKNNTLDVFITNRPSLIQKCKPVPGVSDHDIVFVESNISATRSKPTQRKILLWKRANYTGMKESVNLASTSFMEKHKASTDVNQLWGDFKDMCHQAISNNVPSKLTTTRFSQPWINRNVKRLSRRKKKAYRRA